MGHQPGHDYDSFVVRLWRDSGDRSLLRAEIEHVQSGRVSASVGHSWASIADALDAAAPPDTAMPSSLPAAPAGRRRVKRPSRPVL
jgi:hypothetical protein